MWAIGSFYFATKRQWLWAGIFGFMAAGTRLVGLALFPALLLEFWLTYRSHWRTHANKLWPILCIPGSLVLYMIYQWATVGNPIQFFTVQKLWGREINLDSAARALKDVNTGFHLNQPSNLILRLDALTTIGGIIAAAMLAYRRYFPLALYSLLVIVIPLTSGQTTGMIRYIMAAFPVFMLTGSLLKNRSVFIVVLLISVLALGKLSLYYLNNFWLA
jgi:hypothetical protein